MKVPVFTRITEKIIILNAFQRFLGDTRRGSITEVGPNLYEISGKRITGEWKFFIQFDDNGKIIDLW